MGCRRGDEQPPDEELLSGFQETQQEAQGAPKCRETAAFSQGTRPFRFEFRFPILL